MIHPISGKDVCPWCREERGLRDGEFIHTCFDIVEVLEKKIKQMELDHEAEIEMREWDHNEALDRMDDSCY